MTSKNWISKEEAGRLLHVRLRQVERRIEQGCIRKKVLPRKPTQKSAHVVVSRADVLALKAGKPNSYPVPLPPIATPEPPTAAPEMPRTETSDAPMAMSILRENPLAQFAALA